MTIDEATEAIRGILTQVSEAGYCEGVGDAVARLQALAETSRASDGYKADDDIEVSYVDGVEDSINEIGRLVTTD